MQHSVLLLFRKLSIILLGLTVGKWITRGYINLPDRLYPRTHHHGPSPVSGLMGLAELRREFKK